MKTKSGESLPVFADRILTEIVHELVNAHKCHTVILYGSRARGDATVTSDYDVMGVRSKGKKFRIAEKRRGFFLDLFIFSDDELKKIGDEHVYMSGGKVLYEKGTFGARLLKKVETVRKKPYRPLPPDEIHVRRLWLHKMFDRAAQRDLEGNYRRSWLHEALLCEYFHIRGKRYWGSKKSFAWLKRNDSTTLRLFDHVLKFPLDLRRLKRLVERVSGLKQT